MEQNNKKTITIMPVAVEVIKTGKSAKNGKTFSWTLWKIQAIHKGKQMGFTSFDDFTSKLNSEISVELEETVREKDGREYVNYQISFPKINFAEKIANLENRVAVLENILAARGAKVPPKAEEVDVENLNF